MPPATSPNQSQPTVYPPASAPVSGFDPNMPLPKPKRHINMLLVPLILAILFLIATIAFGFWVYMDRNGYKNKSDQKVAAAVATAKAEESQKKETEFVQREKEPLKEYKGPATFGSVLVKYPKTWSAFIAEVDDGAVPIDGYMHPNFVPGLQSGTAFALHFQVTNSSYSEELKRFEGSIRNGEVTVVPATVPKVANVTGVRLTGKIDSNKNGVMVMFPLRDKTLKVATESTDFVNDLDKIILANIEFAP